jgi:hypothetical protein
MSAGRQLLRLARPLQRYRNGYFESTSEGVVRTSRAAAREVARTFAGGAQQATECGLRRSGRPAAFRRQLMLARHIAALLFAALLVGPGCYHYRFEQEPVAPQSHPRSAVRHTIRSGTWINGLVGTGEVDTRLYCERPLSTELRVSALDVLISVGTLLIYTPHTLTVTCPAAPGSKQSARRSD